jgi:hypothetical protein
MPRTQIEKRIRHQRKRKGILVPLIEDFMARPVNIESQADARFIHALTQTMIEREERRRGDEKVFSPSALSECLRYIYLAKNFKELGIPRVFTTRVEPNFYFLTGNFLHIKWQFALYKLDQVTDDDDFKLIAVEHQIISKHGDHGGTIDVLCEVDREPLIVDFKGLNVRDWGKIARNEIPGAYRIQCADYGMLYNASKDRPAGKVKRVLLIAENKGGPTNDYPAALCESEINVRDNLPEVRARLEVLRTHEKENTIPPPECVSTGRVQFTGCPFRKYCKKEVQAIERERKSKDSNSPRHKLAIPPRRGANSARRNPNQ